MIATDRRHAHPTVTRQPGMQIVRRRAADAWQASIVPNPPGAALIVECRCATGAREVSVLLDGVAAPHHPSVYVATEDPELMTHGAEAEYLLVLEGGRPRFDRIEIVWSDTVTGEKRRYDLDARAIAI